MPRSFLTAHSRTEEASTGFPEMLLLSYNTQRQGVLMAHVWVLPKAPLLHHLEFHAIVSKLPEHVGRGGRDGCGLYGCFAKMCEMGVWVLRVLAQLGVYCPEDWDPCWHPWSPPLTQKLCFTPSVFLSTSFSLSRFLSVTCTIPFFSFLFALSHSKRIWRVLLAAVSFNWIHTWRLVVDGSGDGPLSLCFTKVN